MKRPNSSEKEGANVSGVTEDDIIERFGMSRVDYQAMPHMCRLALMEAFKVGKARGTSSNIYLVIGQSEDGDNYEQLFYADNGEQACRMFIENEGWDDDDGLSSLVAYAMPNELPARKGVIQWGGVNCHRQV